MNCQHQWKPSHNNLGLFAWKCEKCQAIKEADPNQESDRQMLLMYAQKLSQEFYESFEAWKNAPKREKKAYKDKVHARYWVTRISYLRAGIRDSIVQSEDLEQQFPCPPELQLIYSVLKPPPLTPWDHLSEPVDKIPRTFIKESSTSEKGSRKIDEEINTKPDEIPRTFIKESSTSEKGSRKPDGEINTKPDEIPRTFIKESSTSEKGSRKRRLNGLGKGTIFTRSVVKGKNVYQEYWFKYVKGDRQKSLYIPKIKLSQVQKMNEEKQPVNDIINYINSKDKSKYNKARDS